MFMILIRLLLPFIASLREEIIVFFLLYSLLIWNSRTMSSSHERLDSFNILPSIVDVFNTVVFEAAASPVSVAKVRE